MRRIWAVSLLVISLAKIILAESRLIGAELPDALIRTLGVIDLIVLPVLSFTSIKMFQKK